jgi:hypothetical protein
MMGRLPMESTPDQRGVLGDDAEQCALGSDCPFEPSLRRLQAERHDRVAVEGQLAASIDHLGDKLSLSALANEKLALDVEKLSRKLVDLEAVPARVTELAIRFDAHLRGHRFAERTAIGVASAIGGALVVFVVRLLGG